MGRVDTTSRTPYPWRHSTAILAQQPQSIRLLTQFSCQAEVLAHIHTPWSKVMYPTPIRKMLDRVRRQAVKLNAVSQRSAYQQANTLLARYPNLRTRKTLTQSEFKVFSQNGEDGVLAEIFHRVGTSSESLVEIGAGNGSQNNSAVFVDLFGWSGVLVDSDPENARDLAAKYQYNERVSTHRRHVTTHDVDAIVREGAYDDAQSLDLLSIDVDSVDYHLWRAVRSVQPRVVVIEYNASLPLGRSLVMPLDAAPRVTEGFYGASIDALIKLGREKGYTLVHTELAGVNAFFVRDDLVPKLGGVEPVLRAWNHHLDAGRSPDFSSLSGWQKV